ncbi:hypothetical protein DICVIV_13888 [Dictyocaulus viviparus]|uniref:Uncharacterized protein n=1 Tax=Dictyocaulus viviparus TaxID=29172 RepID=A0A0D8X998_DICVI|nr:hypothetical protein DICVIV_13888 [Dictyocaulus viviparus]
MFGWITAVILELIQQVEIVTAAVKKLAVGSGLHVMARLWHSSCVYADFLSEFRSTFLVTSSGTGIMVESDISGHSYPCASDEIRERKLCHLAIRWGSGTGIMVESDISGHSYPCASDEIRERKLCHLAIRWDTKVFRFLGNRTAKLKLREIDGMAIPGVELAA